MNGDSGTRIDLPILSMHGDDDQIVQYIDVGVLSATQVENGTLKRDPALANGRCTTHPPIINPDLQALFHA